MRLTLWSSNTLPFDRERCDPTLIRGICIAAGPSAVIWIGLVALFRWYLH